MAFKPKFEPQKLKYFNDSLVIYAVDFPIYFIECISERHFIIAGGGGSSKTGVLNQINIIELIPYGESCAADLITKYQTPKEHPDAIMNGAIMRDLPIVETQLLTGGTQLNAYHIRFNPIEKNFYIQDSEIIENSRMKDEVKSIRYSPGQFFTGGTEGHLNIWKIESKSTTLSKNCKIHTKEIDEIDFDPTNQHLITLSRSEGRLIVWNSIDLKPIKEFKKDSINQKSNDKLVTNTFRSCRFAYDSKSQATSKNTSYLLVGCNPMPVKGPSIIYKYNTNDYGELKSQQVTMDGIMAMTTSQDGRFVGIGTRTGGVCVFDVKKLNQIYKIDSAHLNAVTRVEFLPTKQESLLLANCAMCPLLSVSFDRRIVLHRPRRSSYLGSICKVIIVVLVIYFMFFALHDYLALNFY